MKRIVIFIVAMSLSLTLTSCIGENDKINGVYENGYITAYFDEEGNYGVSFMGSPATGTYKYIGDGVFNIVDDEDSPYGTVRYGENENIIYYMLMGTEYELIYNEDLSKDGVDINELFSTDENAETDSSDNLENPENILHHAGVANIEIPSYYRNIDDTYIDEGILNVSYIAVDDKIDRCNFNYVNKPYYSEEAYIDVFCNFTNQTEEEAIKDFKLNDTYVRYNEQKYAFFSTGMGASYAKLIKAGRRNLIFSLDGYSDNDEINIDYTKMENGMEITSVSQPEGISLPTGKYEEISKRDLPNDFF